MSLYRFFMLALFLCPLMGCAGPMKTWIDEPLELAKQRLLDAPHDVRNHLALATLYMDRRDYLRAVPSGELPQAVPRRRRVG